ncbi:MAG: efflux RND transporter periplasmic adaptor subunit [Xanthomonadales bacterium]|nr:efflux RND transporter periplasmic adaptor subunit [Xanthomonadales bacterium]
MADSDTAAMLQQLRIDRRDEPTGSRTGLWIVSAIVAVLVLGAGAWALFLRDDATVVQTASARAIGGGVQNASVLDATGYVVARRMATVSAKITGKVLEVRIEEGQRVEEGEVMARLDPVDAQAQYDLAAAQLAASRSQIDSLGAQLREAEANVKRLQALIERKLAPASQLDAAVAQRDSLRAQKITAERNAKVAGESLAIAQNGLDNTVVRAPFAGVVIAKAAQPGEIVSPLSAGGGFTRTGIGTVVDMDSLEVEVDVNEAFIGRVSPGMPVQATLNAYADWKIPAEVIAIIPAADRGKATVRVRVALKEKDSRIVPDMGVRVSFLEQAAPASAENTPKGVLVPSAAILRRDGQSIAYTIKDGHAVAQQLELGRSLGNDREVLAGLAAGQRVIVDPPAQLAEGSAVREAEAKKP